MSETYKTDNKWRAELAAAPAQPAVLAYKDDPRSPSELSLAGCRCVRFGEGNQHWPCMIHPALPAAHDQGEVQRLREALECVKQAGFDCGNDGWGVIHLTNDDWQIVLAALATSTGQREGGDA